MHLSILCHRMVEGWGGGVGNPGAILTIRFSNVNFPTIRSPLEVKLCCCRKYPYSSHGKFFFYIEI